MPRGDSKIDPRRMVVVHFRSLVDARTDRSRVQDYAWLLALPAVVGIGCGVADVRLPVAASAGLLTVAGLLGAVLLGLMLQVGDRASAFADARPTPSEETSSRARYLLELTANAGYASLVSIVAAIAFVVSSVTQATSLRVASAIGLCVGSHLLLTMTMVMKRWFALTEAALDDAATGKQKAGDSRDRQVA